MRMMVMSVWCISVRTTRGAARKNALEWRIQLEAVQHGPFAVILSIEM